MSMISYVRYSRETRSTLSSFKIRTYRRDSITTPIYMPVLNKNKLCFNYYEGIHDEGRKVKTQVTRIILESGKTLLLTEDMEVYDCNLGWTQVKDVKSGSLIGVQGYSICLRCGSSKFLTGQRWIAKYRNICKECLYTYFRNNPEGERLYNRCLRFNILPLTDVNLCAQYEILYEKVERIAKLRKPVKVMYLTAKEPYNSFIANNILVRKPS